MGAITSAVIAIAAVILGWITIEIACKPCLEKGREAIDRSLNPDYDPDDVQAPLNPDRPDPDVQIPDPNPIAASSSPSSAVKSV